MVQALNSALGTLTYKRVRQVHPAILGGHVDHIITTFKDGLSNVRDEGLVVSGTLWPMSTAGCEAAIKPQGDAILEIVDQAGDE